MQISSKTEKQSGHYLVLPKGYIGSDRPGLLPYAISQNPKQVILMKVRWLVLAVEGPLE